MYQIKKDGSFYRVLSSTGLVQFSSLKRAHCSQWLQEVQETQEEKEQKYLCEDVETA